MASVCTSCRRKFPWEKAAAFLLSVCLLSCGGPPQADGPGVPAEPFAQAPPGGTTPGGTPIDDGALDAVVECETPLAGALPEGRTDSLPGFEAELAAARIDTLPAMLPVPASASVEALVRYLLDAPSTDGELTRERAEAAGLLGDVVLGAYAVKAGDGTGGVNLTFLRRGLYRYYACATGQPRTLADFVHRFGDYRSWPETTINPSKPKGGTRLLRQKEGLSVAETLSSDGVVRETEVLWKAPRRDGALVFWAYDESGAATNVSVFATSTGKDNPGPSPFTCMACHLNRETGRYDLFAP